MDNKYNKQCIYLLKLSQSEKLESIPKSKDRVRDGSFLFHRNRSRLSVALLCLIGIGIAPVSLNFEKQSESISVNWNRAQVCGKLRS